MRQALGSASTPDIHYVTQLAGHRSSTLACSFRTAAATFSYASPAELLQNRPVQPSLQGVVLRDPPAVSQAAVGSSGNDNGSRHRVQNQEEVQQLLLPVHKDRCTLSAPTDNQIQEILLLQDVQQTKLPLRHVSINADDRYHNSQQPSRQTCDHPTQQQQQQQQEGAGRIERQWSSMRNWQWLASQQQCTGSSSSSLQDIVNIITQLSQPGVAPSQHDQQQRHGFHVFLAKLLQAATQHLLVNSASSSGSSSSGSEQQSSVAALARDVTDLLWGLAKLRVQPQWPQQQQQQQHSQTGLPVRRSPANAAASLVRQRSAAAIDAAVRCLHVALSQQQRIHSPRQLALCGWALAKLQYAAAAAHQHFWQQYLAAVQQQLSAFSDQDLSNVIWALAKVQHRPDSVWTNCFLSAARQVLCSCCHDSSSSSRTSGGSSSGSSGQSTAVIMLSLAQLGITPAAEWIDAVLLSMLQRPRVGQQLLPQQDSWQQQQQLDGLLQQYDGYALASILGAVAKWGHVPQQQWMQAVQLAVQQQLDKCSGHDIAQISWALAILATAAVARNAASAPLLDVASSSSSSSRGWDSNQQEPGLVMLQRQLLLNSRSSSRSRNDFTCQQQQQQQQLLFTGHVESELLLQLSQRLADTAHSTDPYQVVLGMWAVTKLHQVAQKTFAGSSSSSIRTGSGATGAKAGQLHLEREHIQQQQYYSNSSSFQSTAGRQAATDPNLLEDNKQQYSGTGTGHWQQQQQRLHWQQCRKTLLHCTFVLNQQSSIPSLDCKHLALLVWSLATAGGQVDTGQHQQQQDLLLLTNTPSRKRSRTSSSSSTAFSVPYQFVQQMLSASRDSLAAGDPQSQAMLLRGLVNLGVQPGWQWLLRFYEASEPQLNHSNATDLSMMAGALAQLNLRPLGAWRASFLQASTSLAESRGLDADSLVTVVAAVAGRSWGLAEAGPAAAAAAAAVKSAELPGQQTEMLVPGWHAAVTQQTLLLLPQLSLLQISAMIRAAAALSWSSSCRECVDSLLTRALQLTNHHQQQQHQQQLGRSSIPNPPGQHYHQVVEVLQVMAAAAVLQVSAVPDSWWLHMTTYLSDLCHLQQQEAAGLSPILLCAGTRTLTAVLRKQQEQQQILIACLQQLITAAARQVNQLSVSQSLQLLSTAHYSLTSVRTVEQDCDQLAGLRPGSPRPDSQADQVRTSQAAGSPADQDSSQAEALQQLHTAVQRFSAVVQDALVQQVPKMDLQQLAAVLSVASNHGLLLPVQHSVGAAETAAPTSPLLLVGLSVIEQQLQLIIQSQQQAMQQHQQHSEQRQQRWRSSGGGRMLQQQPRQQQQQHSSHIAGDLATLLAAFARCGYRPGSKLLRRMLRQVQLGLFWLDAQQLSDVAAAAATLQLKNMLGPGFRAQYWMAVSAALKWPVLQYSPVSPLTAAAPGNNRPWGLGMHMRAAVLQRFIGSMPAAVAGCSRRNHTRRVISSVKALHDLTVLHWHPILAQQCNVGSSSCSSSGHLQISGTRSSTGLGAPPPRALVEQAFGAAAAVWSDLGSTRNRQNPQHKQQVQLLRLLVPLASRLSSSGLKHFTLVVGPQLRHLPVSERRKARAVWNQMLAAWRVGKEHRQRLVRLQQQRRAMRQAQQKQEQEQVLRPPNIDTETKRSCVPWAIEDWQRQQPAVATVMS